MKKNHLKVKEKNMTLKDSFSQVEKLFDELFYENGNPIVARLSHDLSEKMNLEGHEHNCIGCNLSASINDLHFFIQTAPVTYNKAYCYKFFFHLSYLMVEQLDFIYKIFENKGYLRDDDVFVSKYPTFIKVKRWANFFKHPKYFILVHHPDYTFENDKSYKRLTAKSEEKIIVDDDFVKKYYKGDGNRELLSKKIANKSNIVVIFPNLVKLTKDFHKDLERFIGNIIGNEDYMRIINEEATLENYFELEDD